MAERKSNPSAPNEPAWLEAEALIGRVLDKRYELRALLGTGGTAAVYRASHLGIEEQVAVKVLLPRSFGTKDHLLRTLREARLAVRLRHPNVVDVRDVSMGSEVPYIVMELLEGETLAAHLLQRGRLGPEETLALLLPVFGALACAHDQGILHRDLKPANVFLARDGHTSIPKLLDFGLARSEHGDTITQSGTIVGTPSYMSPEQARDEPLGPETDVWSMGVLLFHCLSGELPFRGTSMTDVLLKVVTTEAPLLHQITPSVPLPISFAVARALQRDVRLRPKSMRVFARMLLDAASQAGVAVPHAPDPKGLPQWAAWRAECASSSQQTTSIAGQKLVGAQEDARVPVLTADTLSQPKRRTSWPLVLGVVALIAVGLFLLTTLAPKTQRAAVPKADTSSSAKAPPATREGTNAKSAELGESEKSDPEIAAKSTAPAEPEAPKVEHALAPSPTAEKPAKPLKSKTRTRTSQTLAPKDTGENRAPERKQDIPDPLLRLDTSWQ